MEDVSSTSPPPPAMTREPTCPRCGYDLRGAVATWGGAGACPLDGTCTECGLEYCWRDVMRAEYAQPTWCVEYVSASPLALFRGALGTLARSLRPKRFWTRLELHHEPKPGRLVIYGLFWIGVPLVILALVWLAVFPFVWAPAAQPPLANLLRMAATWSVWAHGRPIGVLLFCQVTFALTFLLLPITRRRCKVRGIHLFRIAAYGSALPAPLFGIVALLRLLGWHAPFPLDLLLSLAAITVAAAAPILLAFFWYSAIRRNLRLPHSLAVLASLGVVTLLFVALLRTVFVLMVRY